MGPNTSISTWVTAFNQMTGNLSEYERLLALRRCLKDRASTWFHDQAAQDERCGVVTPVAVWLHRLEVQFAQPVSSRRRVLEERKQHRGESASVFASDLRHLLTSLDPGMRDTDLVQYLKKQMHQDYREQSSTSSLTRTLDGSQPSKHCPTRWSTCRLVRKSR